MDSKGKVGQLRSEHGRNTICNGSPDGRCNAYKSSIQYNDGWRRVYMPCEYCQTDWYKEVMDQLNKDLPNGYIEG